MTDEIWNVEVLLSAAQEQTGLSDFGEPPFKDGLEVLAESVNNEAENLKAKPEMLEFERQEVIDRLCQRLKLIEDRKQNPAIASKKIVKPLFVIGLPRTGTTHTHHLLSLDPANRYTSFWELLRPSPPPEAVSYYNDPRIAEVNEVLHSAGLTEENLGPMHAFSSTNPEECQYIFEYAFRSQNQSAKIQKPLFSTWLAQADMVPAYQLHRMFLQHLQWRCPGERWILKSPQIITDIKALLEVYPDAVFVVTHRDPKTMFPSLLSICNALHDLYHDGLDRSLETRKWLDILPRATRELVAISRDHRYRDQFVHVTFSELTSDPVTVVEKIYDHIGAPFTAETAQFIEQHMTANPRYKLGKHRYNLEEFGLTEAIIEEEFSDYIAAFNF